MNQPTPAPDRTLPWAAGAAALYLAFALWQLYPAWLAPSHGVVGDWLHPDMISNHWLYRWVTEQIVSGGSILHNDRYYFPVGDAPFLAGNGSDAVLHLPLALLLPWPASVTAWCVILVVLNGLSGFALARVSGARGPVALLSGAILATLPYVLHEMSCARVAQVPVAWMVFFLAAWVRHLDRPTPVQGVVAGIVFGLCAFEYWYYGLWAAVAGGVLFLARPRWRALVSFVPVALAVTVPPLVLFLSHWTDIPGTVEEPFPHPLALETALPFTFPVWGGTGPRKGLVLPLVLLALAGVGVADLWRRRQARLQADAEPTDDSPTWAWGAVALVFYLLTLGPHLVLPDETDTGIPGPFLLAYGAVAPLRRYWWPYRHEVVLAVALLPLLVRGAQRWLPRFGRKAPAVAVVLALLLPLDLALRGGATAAATAWWQAPEAYERLAPLEGDVILELPLSPALARSQPTLSYQWVHGKTLFNGHAMWVDRVRPRAWDERVAANAFLVELQAYEQGRVTDGTFDLTAGSVEALRTDGVRYLVVNAEYFPGRIMLLVPRYHALFEALFGKPVLAWRDLVLVWDLARYDGATSVPVPTFTPEESALSEDGTLMPEAGPVRSLGWRPLARLFPPEIPPKETTATDGFEAMPDMLKRKLRRTDLSSEPQRRAPEEVEGR